MVSIISFSSSSLIRLMVEEQHLPMLTEGKMRMNGRQLDHLYMR